MTPAEIRCTAPHPSVPGWECRGVLTRAVPGTVVVRPGGDPPPGCVELKCTRRGCGAVYVVCARAA